MPVEPDVYSSKELSLMRDDQKDPWIQYLIVRKSLNMSPGKVAAQCNHAGKYIMKWFYKFFGVKLIDYKKELVYNIIDWSREGGRVAILKANDKQWEKIKEELRCIAVKDAGVNSENTRDQETVLALFPMKKSLAPKLIKRLQVYNG